MLYTLPVTIEMAEASKYFSFCVPMFRHYENASSDKEMSEKDGAIVWQMEAQFFFNALPSLINLVFKSQFTVFIIF